MPDTVFGLPIHPLIVHATVVAVPVTALLLGATLFSPKIRDWAGPLPMILALVSTVLAPLSTSSGENLEHMVGESKLVQEHAELGDMLVWWCIGMLVVAAASYFLRRNRRELARGASIAIVAAGVVVSLGTLVQVVLIGHSGAEAAWSGVASSSASSGSQSGSDGDDG